MKLLTTTEAADALRMSIGTLENWRTQGKGPRYLKAGPGTRTRVLYRESDIAAWIEANLEEPTPSGKWA